MVQRVAHGRGKVGKGPLAVKPEERIPSSWNTGATAEGICRPRPPPLSCPAVPRLDPSVVEVYVFRRRGRRLEILALRRALDRRLPGVWQPVTGGLHRGERAVRGALREVFEETGLRPQRLWRLESVTAWFDVRSETVRVTILFAMEIGPRDAVRLSHEHTAHRFLSAREAAKRFLWDSQRRALAEVRRQVIRGGRQARALEIDLPASRG